jgi:hypothetical protein
VQSGDSFVRLSVKYFGTEVYAKGLYDYNKAHPLVTDFKQRAQLQVGDKIYIPEKAQMERLYGRPTTAPAGNSAGTIATSGSQP